MPIFLFRTARDCRPYLHQRLRRAGFSTSLPLMGTEEPSSRMNLPDATLRTELQGATTLFESFLARFFQENTERYAYGALSEPLYLDISEFVGRRGKRIRPMLLLASFRIFGGTRSFAD